MSKNSSPWSSPLRGDRKSASLQQPLILPVHKDFTEELASGFQVKEELKIIANLAIPLLISFGARFAMASTDNGFVGMHVYCLL